MADGNREQEGSTMTDEKKQEQAKTEYRVGDQVYEVRPFKGSKGVRAFAIVSRVGEHARPIWEADARFQQDFRELNKLTITRDLAAYRVEQAQTGILGLEARAQELREGLAKAEAEGGEDAEERIADFKEGLDAVPSMIEASERTRDEWSRMIEGPLKDQAKIEVPQAPSTEQRALAAFPMLWDVAEPEMTMLLGLVLLKEDDLREARAAGKVDEACQELGEQLLDELEMDEIGELLLVAVRTALERFQARRSVLGNLLAGVRDILTPAETTVEQEEQASGIKTEPTVGSVELPSTSDSSSTDSPEPSDGTPTESSTENSGQTLSPMAS